MTALPNCIVATTLSIIATPLIAKQQLFIEGTPAKLCHELQWAINDLKNSDMPAGTGMIGFPLSLCNEGKIQIGVDHANQATTQQ